MAFFGGFFLHFFLGFFYGKNLMKKYEGRATLLASLALRT